MYNVTMWRVSVTIVAKEKTMYYVRIVGTTLQQYKIECSAAVIL